MPNISKKQSRIWLLIPLSVLLFHSISYAKVYIDITSPISRRIPIAIAEFKNLKSQIPPNPSTTSDDIANSLREVLINDLNFSGLFDIIDRKAYIEDPKRAGIDKEEIDFSDWRVIGSELLIKGGYKENPTSKECEEEEEEDGDDDEDEEEEEDEDEDEEDEEEESDLLIEVRLFDVVTEMMVTGYRYCTNKRWLRTVMHRFANAIVKEITGEDGIFETKLAFIDSSSDNKEVYISDYDGYNRQMVTKDDSINLSPQWSPDGRWLLFTSFKEGQPKLYIKNPYTGMEFKIAEYPGLNIGARWSPSGKEIALTLSLEGNPEIYIIDLKARKLTRLTNHWGIDVSPTWSPDGKRIAFVSDRAGNPHIYVMDADGKNIKRLTYEGRFNVSPAWSPKGDLIAFSRLEKDSFDIWLITPDGLNERRLTSNAGNNEDPSWSPDGRYIVFKSDRNGQSNIYIMKADGTNPMKITKGSNPSWSP